MFLWSISIIESDAIFERKDKSSQARWLGYHFNTESLPLGSDPWVPQRDLDLAGPAAGSQVPDQGVLGHAGNQAKVPQEQGQHQGGTGWPEMCFVFI